MAKVAFLPSFTAALYETNRSSSFVGQVSIPMQKKKKQLNFQTKVHSEAAIQRSASKESRLRDYDAIKKLPNIDDLREEKLKEEVKQLFRDQNMQPSQQLELIDDIQRLGLEHHFVKEIDNILQMVKFEKDNVDYDLYATALQFRLLRLHGCSSSSQNVFERFVDEKGKFKECLRKDVKGMLSLYEAAQLGFEGESLLEEANVFCVHHLQEHLASQVRNFADHRASLIADEVEHALQFPFSRRITWIEIRWYIQHYRQRRDIHPSLLELAQMNFNAEQIRHQNELQSITRWWSKMRLETQLEFAKNGCLEAYFSALATIPEPHFSGGREKLAKVFLLITLLDDMYDGYGTICELELFTDAVQQWDAKAIEQLPEYMKICFLTLFNEINDISRCILNEHGFDFTSVFSKMWGSTCKSFLIEAKWIHNQYTPSFQEYLNNGVVSSSGCLAVGHAYCFINQQPNKEDLQYLESDPEAITLTSLIFRLCNDLITSQMKAKTGGVQAYAREFGLSEEAARNGIIDLVDTTWKRLMKECLDPVSSCPKLLANLALKSAITVQGTYKGGSDAYREPDETMKRMIQSVLLDPIIIPKYD